MSRHITPLLLGLALVGCGGGGSGGAGGVAANPEGAWLTFTPNPVAVSSVEGDSTSFQVTATSSRTFAKPFNIAIVDSTGVITTNVNLSALSELQYRATLQTSPDLRVGEHPTTLEVRLCEDDPLVCRSPLPGSPWRVPLNVTVKPSPDATKHVTVTTTPAALALTTYPGEVATIDLKGTIGGDALTKSFQVGVIDPSAATTSVLNFADAHGFSATLTTSASLVQGDYNGNVEVRLCFDDPRTCRQPVAGSPWLVPLKISVKSPTNLTALVPIAGVGAWSTYQGNAAHTGFVPASFDFTKFSRRWNIPAGSNYSQPLDGAASDNGMVFVTRTDPTGAADVVALSEATGKEVWHTALGKIHHVNAPAAGNGQVYVTTTGHEDTFMWMFDQRSGTLLSKTSMSSQWENYLAPTVVGTDVYTESGYYGGMSKFSSVTGSQTWWANMPQYDSWTPAVDARYAYGYMSGQLIAVDVATGNDRWTVTDPENSWAGYGGAPVVLTNDLAFVANGGRVMAFDIAKHTRAWSVTGTVTGQPAFGNGTLYVLNANGTVLEARAPADGRLQWTSESLGSDFFTRVIVTRNLAFVSSAMRTVAIDLVTHKAVWSYPLGGDLSISANGILYILGTTGGALAAVNLQ
ncbi:PQQ-like beta-propeller repeat protein [Telluria mixta]|uniref:PQQ-like beta-propeller repeat protein n=1 Tax=Telluria mixta TaxID=34071 RepID=A0ABT2C9G5_9BURK|nr:PQQ-binding-like beta-propeller repeat protein [Telluria mixta]MCS0633782.1 PQQ-like beta-propeller repeat protein [Telluria mixta]WEM95071.1 PQQ-like beta-propeller repeat protein [Telluria mixta]